jgi:hypothetical protein
MATVVETASADVAAVLRQGAGASSCASKKLAAVGVESGYELKLYGKQLRSPNPDRAGKGVGRAVGRLEDVFARTEAAGGCATVGDLRAVRVIVRNETGDVLEALWPLSATGVALNRPQGWHLDALRVVLGGTVWFNNFGGAYLRGGFVPDGGADFGIASFPLQPDSLDHIIRADIAPDPIISLTEIVVDGLPGKRATYRHSFAGESQTFVIVYVPKGNRLYKLSLNYNTGDPNAADFLAAFDAAVASTHFTS